MVKRYDRGEVRTPETTDAGFLRADAYVTRAGVFVYRDAQGRERRELRHPDEVFAPASLASLQMAPITFNHPPDVVTSENARELTVGHIGDSVTRDDEFVKTPVLVTDAAAVKAVLDGTHRETSCGYTADVIDEVGTYDGEPYDSVQRTIRYNHVALVPRGRAGPEVRVRLDADSMAQVEITSSTAPRASGGHVLVKVRKDGVTIELEEGQAQTLQMLLEKIEAANGESAAQLADMKTKLVEAQKGQSEAMQGQATAKGEADAAKAKVDALEAQLKTSNDPARIDSAVRERVALETKARPVLGETVKLDGLTGRQVKALVLEKLTPGFKADTHDDAYVNGRFDAALELNVQSRDALDSTRRAAEGDAARGRKTDAADPDTARQRMIHRHDGKDDAAAQASK
jgi:hypothetical protein